MKRPVVLSPPVYTPVKMFASTTLRPRPWSPTSVLLLSVRISDLTQSRPRFCPTFALRKPFGGDIKLRTTLVSMDILASTETRIYDAFAVIALSSIRRNHENTREAVQWMMSASRVWCVFCSMVFCFALLICPRNGSHTFFPACFLLLCFCLSVLSLFSFSLSICLIFLVSGGVYAPCLSDSVL